MSGTTTRLTIPYPSPSDPNNVPSDMQNMADRIDGIIGAENFGLLAARPAAGNEGFKYFAVDQPNAAGANGVWYYDNGSTWIAVNPAALAPASVTASGAVVGQTVAPSGLTGATAASRHVGATTSGPPVTGTFQAGDTSIDRTGATWICVIGGTPGSWVAAPRFLFVTTQTADVPNINGVQMLMGAGTGVATSDGGGVLAYTFTTAFPTACDLVLPMPGDTSGLHPNQVYLEDSSVTRTGFSMVIYNPSGSTVPGAAVRMNYLAFGH